MSNSPDVVNHQPNPQGKGLVPLLRDWSTLSPRVATRKSPAEFLRDYCVSSLVLAAKFRFKPVIGKTYFLYAGESDWTLSLIAPHEWSDRKSGEFFASCRVRPDMTWEIDAAELSRNDNPMQSAKRYIEGFVDGLSRQQSISDELPYYVKELGYYQRILATALASSLSQTLPYTGDSVKALLQSRPEVLALIEHPGPPTLPA